MFKWHSSAFAARMQTSLQLIGIYFLYSPIASNQHHQKTKTVSPGLKNTKGNGIKIFPVLIPNPFETR